MIFTLKQVILISEPVTMKSSVKKTFFKISENFVSGWGLLFSCQLCKIHNNTYFIDHLRTTSSVILKFAVCLWYNVYLEVISNLINSNRHL